MASAKAKLYEELLDQNRCNGNWSAIQESTRKLLKHNPSKQYICSLAKAEAAFYLHNQREDSISTVNLFRIDAETVVPALQSSIVNELSSSLQSLESMSGTEVEKAQAVYLKLILHLSAKEYDTAVSIVRDPQGLPLSTDYSCVALLKAIVLSAIAYECLSQEGVAMSFYQRAFSVVKKASAAVPSDMKVSFGNTPEFGIWAEAAFYRNSVLCLQKDPNANSSETLDAFYAYYVYLSSHPSRKPEHLPLFFSNFVRTLVSHHKKYEDPAAFYADENVSRVLKQAPDVLEKYADTLIQHTPFPKAGTQNLPANQFLDNLYDIWKLIPFSFESTRRCIELVYLMAQKTYQSHRLLRYLIILHDSVDESLHADFAFKSYRILTDTALERVEKEKLKDAGVADETDLNKGEILDVYARMLIIYVVKLKDQTKAKECANQLFEKAKVFDFLKLRNQTTKCILHALGVYHSFVAFTSVDPKAREAAQLKSIDFFRDCCGVDPSDAVVQYHLARQLAEARRNDEAVEILRKDLLGQPESSIEAWHLFALLLSCSEQYKAALMVIDSILGVWGVPADGGHMEEPSATASLPFHARCTLMELMFTKFALVEKNDGLQVAAGLQSSIFSLFACLFDLPKYNTILSNWKQSRALSVKAEAPKGVNKFIEKDIRVREAELVVRYNQQLWILAASVFRKLKQWDQLLSALKQARELDPDYSAIYHSHALAFIDQHKYSEALEQLELAALLEPDEPYLCTTLAYTLIQLEEPYQPAARNRADGLLDRVTRGRGWNIPEAWFLLAQIHHTLGDEKFTASAFSYAIELTDSEPVRNLSCITPRYLDLNGHL
ncbi:cargo-transporter Ypp1 [Schizosaccharomyces japonicus yFS275]|uniref:Cargo-transporter Ypp1 n=1 Tax=Schizosaccharomyces japonicus (strain yFS275 / FY16936) TaxID=402676 RepID=B6JXJ5_SCHJY|nr:cargo-transporter Ypp1 [Schizosaccharomyces japonicus yFS275]EEB05139.1 cargo-transporter Ypp1 [Schizosaccharomyces japonicus yFS275]